MWQQFLYEFRSLYFVLLIGIVRLAAVFSMLPFFGKRNVMGMGRNAWLFGLSIFVYPVLIKDFGQPDVTLMVVVFLLAKEVIIGVAMGFFAAFIFYVVEGVGNLIDMQRGASAASLFSAFNESQTTVLADFFVQIVLLLFFISGGFLYFVDIVYQSYVVWPIFSFVPQVTGGLVEFCVMFLSDYMHVVFALVGPVLLALFLAEFGLGMVNRFAPQLNVFFLSMGIKSGLSALFIVLYLYFLLGFFSQYFFEKNKMVEFFYQFWR